MSIIDLTKKSVSKYVKTGAVYQGDYPDELKRRKGGVFVTLKHKGELRGCMGTIEPTQENLAKEVVFNSVSACKDTRFSEIKPEELAGLKYEVNVLKEPELIKKEQIGIPSEITDPETEGVIVSSGSRKGLLLPDIEEIDSSKEQLKVALKKGGINPTQGYEIYKFETQKYAGM